MSGASTVDDLTEVVHVVREGASPSVAHVASAVCVAAVVALLVTSRRGLKRAEWVLKPLASTAFVVAAIAHGAWGSRFGVALLAGLTLSWWGDVLLIARSKRFFLAGLVAFLLGHVAYAWAFVDRGLAGGATVAAAVGMALLAIPVMRWLLPSVERAMRAPVIAYLVVISAMVAASIGTALHREGPWIVVGAAAFYVSDLSVARDRFVTASWSNKAWGWPLYFGAQLVLAWCAGRP